MPKHQGRLELTWTNKDKTLLSSGDGKYDYTFVDPSDRRVAEVRLLHETERVEAETPAERPADLPEPTTDNLLITGDAMHVLDALAKIPEYADQYLGKVKLVYIDPPFNTEKTFTHYEDNIEHSIWLTMLRDRLRQLKPLLAPDASVWVHLDDAEVHRCRVVLDEELGAENFVATAIWQKAYSPRNDVKGLSTDQDYILIYSRRPGWVSNRLDRLSSRDALYTSPDGDLRAWVSGDPAAPGARSNDETSIFAIQSPFTGALLYPARGRHWGQGANSMQALVEEWGVPYRQEDVGDADRRAAIRDIPPEKARRGIKALLVDMPLDEAEQIVRARHAQGSWPRLYFTKGGDGGLKRKRYLDEIATDRAPQTLWLHEDVGHSRSAKAEIKALFPHLSPFATPKPERLIQRVIQIATKPGDIVLDCFAGSGTTAAVAHKMGRRWITSELLPENADRFTKPRLSKVVRGEDSGGVTSTKERVATGDNGLPDGMTADEAHKFNTALNKAAKADDVDLDKTALKALRDATRTREVTTVNWHGGGGFTHLVVGPSLFEEVEGMVVLADWATNGALTQAMCAQLGVRHRPDGIFAGRHGRTRLVVIDGMVGPGTIDTVVDQLTDSENVEIWATQVDTDAAERLTDLRPKSRLQRIPDAVLDSYRRKKVNRAGFRSYAFPWPASAGRDDSWAA